jgi:hypothetical protein
MEPGSVEEVVSQKPRELFDHSHEFHPNAEWLKRSTVHGARILVHPMRARV